MTRFRFNILATMLGYALRARVIDCVVKLHYVVRAHNIYSLFSATGYKSILGYAVEE